MVETQQLPGGLPLRRIFQTWWPLAFSWLLMSVEMPALSAVIARLARPEINLAAYGGIVFPLALIIESPIMMLLSASTALCIDRPAYNRIWRFMMLTSLVLTGLHALVAFTPLYYVVARGVIGAPEEIIEPARIGLMIMLPWTWSIAFRRFQQGVLIRYGYSRAVGLGTIVRLVVGGTTLLLGYLVGSLPGVAVGALAQALGVLSEAVYAGWRVRPVLKGELAVAPPAQLLSWRSFAAFYFPLALNSLLFLIWQPIGSAALSRMPMALASLAVWPALSGLVFLLRSPGIAFNEVVVALLHRPGASRSLFRYAGLMALVTSALHLLLALTPLALLYFSRVSALPAGLAKMASTGLIIAIPLTAASVFQSWFQGKILYGKQTRAVPESVVVFLAAVLSVLAGGVLVGGITGLYIVMAGFTLASLAQAGWLWLRGRGISAALRARDG